MRFDRLDSRLRHRCRVGSTLEQCRHEPILESNLFFFTATNDCDGIGIGRSCRSRHVNALANTQSFGQAGVELAEEES